MATPEVSANKDPSTQLGKLTASRAHLLSLDLLARRGLSFPDGLNTVRSITVGYSRSPLTIKVTGLHDTDAAGLPNQSFDISDSREGRSVTVTDSGDVYNLDPYDDDESDSDAPRTLVGLCDALEFPTLPDENDVAVVTFELMPFSDSHVVDTT